VKSSETQPKSTTKRTVVLFIASLLMLFYSLLSHIVQNVGPAMIAVFCTLMVGGAIVAFSLWDKIPALRRFVRTGILVIAGLVVLFSIVLAIVFLIENPASTAGYLFAAYGTLALQVLQAFTSFMLPVLAAASKTDLRFDNVLLFACGFLNALAITVFMCFSVPEGYMPFEYEIPQVMNMYALVAWIVAALSMWPLLSQTVHRPKAKTEENTDR